MLANQSQNVYNKQLPHKIQP